MIKINLLPPEMTKMKREQARVAKLPSSAMPVVTVILVVVYIVVLGFAYGVISKKSKDDNEVKALQLKRDQLKKEVESKQKEFKDLIELRTMLSNQIEILKALDPPNRILWAEKLNMLAEIIPQGVYLTNISVNEDVKEVETEESKSLRETWVKGGKKGDQPPSIKKPIITQTMTIWGITWADDAEQRIQLILKLHDGMQKYVKATGRWTVSLKKDSTPQQKMDFISKYHLMETLPGHLIVAPDQVDQVKGNPLVAEVAPEKHAFMDNFQDQVRIEGTYVGQVAGRNVNLFKLILTTKPVTF